MIRTLLATLLAATLVVAVSATDLPALAETRPAHEAIDIDEQQVFLARAKGPVDAKTFIAHVFCEVEGVRSVDTVRVVGGARKSELLKAAGVTNTENWIAFRCTQNFPSGANVIIRWDSPTASTKQAVDTLRFKVRSGDFLELTCSRENKDAGCNPLANVYVSFKRAIDPKDAARFRLRDDAGKLYSPKAGEEDSEGINFSRLSPETKFTLVVPLNLKELGTNTPLTLKRAYTLRTSAYPPLVKFPRSFGILERQADPALPITVRNLEPGTAGAGTAASIRKLRVTTEQDMIRWYARTLGFQQSDLSMDDEESDYADFGERPKGDEDVRGRSLLKGVAQVQSLPLPKPGGPKEFEVVGLPLAEPGLHVVEAESTALGASLLEKKGSMFVRTIALVTNLAVHAKTGAGGALVWVTRLNDASVVVDANVRIRDCKGAELAVGKTDKDGIARLTPKAQKKGESCPMFIFAQSGDDTAFTRSDWTRGIEQWRFNLPWDYDDDNSGNSKQAFHTILARNLLRPGETVHMKHYARELKRYGTSAPEVSKLPKTVSIINEGNNQRSTMDLVWTARGNAITELKMPTNAKRGQYRVEIGGRTTGRFTVADFRLPVYKSEISIAEANVVGGDKANVDVRLSFLSGGPASGDVVTVRSRFDARTWPGFDALPDYSFSVPEYDEDGSMRTTRRGSKQPEGEDQSLALSTAGSARVPMVTPKVDRPHSLVADMEYKDPNGEIYTAQARTTVWPATVLVGIKTADWAMARDKLGYDIVTTDVTGKPVGGVKFKVSGRNRTWDSYRKRNIGGFYSYESTERKSDLGVLCEGTSDRNGKYTCTSSVSASGEIQLTVEVVDNGGRPASAGTSVWASNGDDWMFRAESSDRIDLLPEKKRYEPNEKARFQVRMPFREATVLVTVERDGAVLSSFVTKLSGKSAVIEMPVKEEWAPNAYVSALLVRGRVGAPVPTALVDLAKPAFKLGIANIDVNWQRYSLNVTVTPDKAEYQTRDKSMVKVKVTRGNNNRAGDNAELAVFAIDEALLELQGNSTWKLLEAMMKRRDYGMTTATAQMQVIGKRHFGRKALPPGGSGGRGAGTRELFDTLILWQGSVVTDANGEASIEVPLNDSLTRFRIVAVADRTHATEGDRFGTGEASIRTTRDLQLFSGLPAVIRNGDEYRAAVTLRNTTQRAVVADVSAQSEASLSPVRPERSEGSDSATSPSNPSLRSGRTEPIKLPVREVRIGSGESAVVTWDVKAPADDKEAVWNFAAVEKGKPRGDALRIKQALKTPLPERTVADTSGEIKGKTALTLKPDTPTTKGDVTVSLARTYGADTSGIRAYFARYPFACLEQRMTRTMGTRDEALWDVIAGSLPNYLSASGLANYYPGDTSEGYPALTAFVLSGAHEAGWKIPDEAKARMLSGLERYVAGELKTQRAWLPNDSYYLLSEKLIALEALSRYDRASKRLLDTIRVDPVKLTAASLADWLDILNRSKDVPNRDAQRTSAIKELRDNVKLAAGIASIARSDDRWYFMRSDDYTLARMFRLSLDTRELGEFKLPLLKGLNNRMQRGGYFYSTQANLWAAYALERHNKQAAADGRTRVTYNGETKEVVWDAATMEGEVIFPWNGSSNGIAVEHLGKGEPWARAQLRAPVALAGKVDNGISVAKTFKSVQQKRPGHYSVGDIIQVTVTADNKAGLGWLAIDDPVPAGSTVLGGLAKLATTAEMPQTWSGYRYIERTFTSVRSSFEWAGKGKHSFTYEIRLTTPGKFALPPTHAEAMYSPEVNGQLGNAVFEIEP